MLLTLPCCYDRTTGKETPINMVRYVAAPRFWFAAKIRSVLFQSLVLKNVELKGSTMGSRDEFRKMVQFVNHHQIKPVVSSIFPLDDIVSLDWSCLAPKVGGLTAMALTGRGFPNHGQGRAVWEAVRNYLPRPSASIGNSDVHVILEERPALCLPITCS